MATHDPNEVASFATLLEQGKFFLPDIETVEGVDVWLPDLEAEILGWTGRKEETADQIDVCSYAADHVRSKGMASIRPNGIVSFIWAIMYERI